LHSFVCMLYSGVLHTPLLWPPSSMPLHPSRPESSWNYWYNTYPAAACSSIKMGSAARRCLGMRGAEAVGEASITVSLQRADPAVHRASSAWRWFLGRAPLDLLNVHDEEPD
jgi:cytochrome P450